MPLAKLGLSIVSGFRLDAKEGAENIHKEMDEWTHRIKLRNKAQNITRCTVRDGTAVAYLPVNKKTGIETIPFSTPRYYPKVLHPARK